MPERNGLTGENCKGEVGRHMSSEESNQKHAVLLQFYANCITRKLGSGELTLILLLAFSQGQEDRRGNVDDCHHLSRNTVPLSKVGEIENGGLKEGHRRGTHRRRGWMLRKRTVVHFGFRRIGMCTMIVV